ncbi:hypothetical protein MMC25_003417 [Agyrium rufum]|nr:hypothetical protein [Agyrium rufum]
MVSYASLQPARKRQRPLPDSFDVGTSEVESTDNSDYQEISTAKRQRVGASAAIREIPEVAQSHAVGSNLSPTFSNRRPVLLNRQDLQTLRWFRDLIYGVASLKDPVGKNKQEKMKELRKRLHAMEFYTFLSKPLLQKSRLLDQALPSIFQDDDGIDWPWDINVDAQALWHKWNQGHFDSSMIRGLDLKRHAGPTGKQIAAYVPDTQYERRVSSHYSGQGDLVNGQWWPLQGCAVRDGAHGEIECGISGLAGAGAYSVVMSRGGYDDVDMGEEVLYCGTIAKEGEPSQHTRYLLHNLETKAPVRLLRSSSLEKSNPYRPTEGTRYDGLYDVIDVKVLDVKTAMHRFGLRRRPKQSPIRYKGPEKRPTPEQSAERSKLRAQLGLK